jgi:energy-coupling factor transporter transmembrane protein EcfT
VPGSPRSETSNPSSSQPPALHPAALLVACALAGTGLALSHSWLDLALLSVLGAAATLRAEGRSLRGEAPLWLLAGILFLAHSLFSGRPFQDAVRPAALIALRLLALLYLLRWAARSFLGRAARWVLGLRLPAEPRWVAFPLESARHTMALVPLAIREADQQHVVLRARGIAPGGGVEGRARYVAAWLLPFLGAMLRIGESYGDALVARGYVLGAPRGSALRLAWGWAETGTIVLGAGLAAWLLRAR